LRAVNQREQDNAFRLHFVNEAVISDEHFADGGII
jgi:hypothetical protein